MKKKTIAEWKISYENSWFIRLFFAFLFLFCVILINIVYFGNYRWEVFEV